MCDKKPEKHGQEDRHQKQRKARNTLHCNTLNCNTTRGAHTPCVAGREVCGVCNATRGAHARSPAQSLCGVNATEAPSQQHRAGATGRQPSRASLCGVDVTEAKRVLVDVVGESVVGAVAGHGEVERRRQRGTRAGVRWAGPGPAGPRGHRHWWGGWPRRLRLMPFRPVGGVSKSAG